MTPDKNVEVEVKLPLAGPAGEAAERLAGLGFVLLAERVLEANTVFDTERRTLKDSRQLLRVRRAGSRGVLTYKGPADTGKYKSREEIELEIGDPDQMGLILARLGYWQVFRYEKFRTEYHRPGEDGTVTVDETPVGNYYEIEGRPDWIDRTAAELGFAPEQYVTESYGSLYLAYCRERQLAPSNMVFRDAQAE